MWNGRVHSVRNGSGLWRDVASPSELWLSCRSGTCRLCGAPPWFGVSQQLRTVRGFERAEISDNRDVAATSTANRGQYVRRGQRLEYFTIAYNSLEGAASIIAGLLAGSVSLVGFGLDSVIEVASGAALLWRLHHDMDTSRREQAERTALRTVGACFIALALYIVYESSSTLIRHVPPERSIAGIVIASASVIVMPLLARAKRRVGRQIGSGAMHADSKQADFCAYLCGILLGGLLLNAFLGWWWMDPVAGLVMVPIIAKEGIAGLRAKACCDGCRID